MQFGNVYASGALDPRGLVKRARSSALAEQSFDTIVGTGLSGALVIPTIAEAFDCQWGIVRKQSDGSHSAHTIEGNVGTAWVFVDDLISTGRTFINVHEAVTKAFTGPFDWPLERPDHPTRWVGAWLYHEDLWVSPSQSGQNLGYLARKAEEEGRRLDRVVTPPPVPETVPWVPPRRPVPRLIISAEEYTSPFWDKPAIDAQPQPF